MARKFQIKRGLKENIPTLAQGELGFTTNSNAEQLYVGNGATNIPMARQDALDTHKSDTTAHVTAAERTKWNGKQDALSFDSTPTSGSTKPVTSGGVYKALQNVQQSLTFDNTPTAGSSNPVKSSGIKSALDEKQAKVTVSGILKGDGNGGVPAAAAGTDYAPAYTYGTTDLTAGTSTLATGKLYFVYE